MSQVQRSGCWILTHIETALARVLRVATTLAGGHEVPSVLILKSVHPHPSFLSISLLKHRPNCPLQGWQDVFKADVAVAFRDGRWHLRLIFLQHWPCQGVHSFGVYLHFISTALGLELLGFGLQSV